jgi:DNA/RNA endonuclease G (NUC1)
MRRLLSLLFLIVAVPLASAQDRNTRFGLPDKLTKADPSVRDHYLIQRPQYILSYNDTNKTPNWVAWQLMQSDLGKASRGAFEQDPLLPKGFSRVVTGTYDLGKHNPHGN